MAYLEANGWSLRKTVYIWGRSVENVEWAMRGAFSKNTDFTDAHGWVFSRIGYSCAAFSGVVLMRRRHDGSARILSHAERNASVEIGEICGRHYAPMALKNWRVICFPTDRTDRHRRETPSVFV